MRRIRRAHSLHNRHTLQHSRPAPPTLPQKRRRRPPAAPPAPPSAYQAARSSAFVGRKPSTRSTTSARLPRTRPPFPGASMAAEPRPSPPPTPPGADALPVPAAALPLSALPPASLPAPPRKRHGTAILKTAFIQLDASLQIAARPPAERGGSGGGGLGPGAAAAGTAGPRGHSRKGSARPSAPRRDCRGRRRPSSAAALLGLGLPAELLRKRIHSRSPPRFVPIARCISSLVYK